MGRLSQATQRARQSGATTGFLSIPEDIDLKRLVADLTDESKPKPRPRLLVYVAPPAEPAVLPAPVPLPAPLPVPAPVVPLTAAPKPAPVFAPIQDSDKEIKELFFNTYFEKVWTGPR